MCHWNSRILVEAIKRKAYNVIITTRGTLDHDIARTYQAYYHGAFELDDVELGEQGLNRLGNVIVPNECYGDILEQSVLPWLEEIEKERRAMNPETMARIWECRACWAFGDRISDESSLLHWAAKHRIQSSSLAI